MLILALWAVRMPKGLGLDPERALQQRAVVLVRGRKEMLLLHWQGWSRPLQRRRPGRRLRPERQGLVPVLVLQAVQVQVPPKQALPELELPPLCCLQRRCQMKDTAGLRHTLAQQLLVQDWWLMEGKKMQPWDSLPGLALRQMRRSELALGQRLLQQEPAPC